MTKGSKVTKRQVELYEVFNMAITSERAAQAMYESVLSYCDDAAIREILTGLRDDEKRHEKELLHLHSQLKMIIDGESPAPSVGTSAEGKVAPKRRPAAR